MKNNLIIYTHRTGSTILGEILSASMGGINLNEGIIDSVFNAPKSLYNEELIENPELSIFLKSLRRHLSSNISPQERLLAYQNDKQERVEKLKTINNWTIKEVTNPRLCHIDFIKYCCDSDNINVYMTYRKCITSQFISYINMIVGKQSMFINNPVYKDIEPLKINEEAISGRTLTFINNLIYWRLVYEMFKDKVTLVNYEDVIKPMNFSSIGIESSVVERYNLRYTHIIPTPRYFVDKDNPNLQASLNEVKKASWIVDTL